MSKFVIASDSFKGTLSSKEICEIFSSEFNRLRPNDTLEKVILGDGGENTLDVFIDHFKNGQIHYLKVHGPNFNIMTARYFVYDNNAVIELAEASGLNKTLYRNPLYTTTVGVGELMVDAYRKGVRNFYLTLGGSSSNDGGCGLLSAIGIGFYDNNNIRFTPTGGTLNKISRIDKSGYLLKDSKITILSDTKIKMFGKEGASYIFAKQKGASDREIESLDANLQYLNKKFIEYGDKDVSNIEGSGAAGATASGLLCFTDSTIVSGIDAILDLIDFKNIILDADYIVTGEGKLDRESYNGKLISGVLKIAKENNIPVICVCGQVEKDTPIDSFLKVYETYSGNDISISARSDYINIVRKMLIDIK